jgi:hypothetical protein
MHRPFLPPAPPFHPAPPHIVDATEDPSQFGPVCSAHHSQGHATSRGVSAGWGAHMIYGRAEDDVHIVDPTEEDARRGQEVSAGGELAYGRGQRDAFHAGSCEYDARCCPMCFTAAFPTSFML